MEYEHCESKSKRCFLRFPVEFIRVHGLAELLNRAKIDDNVHCVLHFHTVSGKENDADRQLRFDEGSAEGADKNIEQQLPTSFHIIAN